MIAIVVWFQQAMTLSQAVAQDIPSLGTIITSVAAGAILFGLRVLDKKLDVLLELRDKTRAMWVAIYGEKEASEPDGLLHEMRQTREEVETLRGDFRQHTADESLWQREIATNSINQANRAQVGLTELGLELKDIKNRLSKRRNDHT